MNKNLPIDSKIIIGASKNEFFFLKYRQQKILQIIVQI